MPVINVVTMVMFVLLQDGNQATWLLPLLVDALRHVYQRALLEPRPDIIEVVTEVSHLYTGYRKILGFPEH